MLRRQVLGDRAEAALHELALRIKGVVEVDDQAA
jgi:hypothetical protein